MNKLHSELFLKIGKVLFGDLFGEASALAYRISLLSVMPCFEKLLTEALSLLVYEKKSYILATF